VFGAHYSLLGAQLAKANLTKVGSNPRWGKEFDTIEKNLVKNLVKNVQQVQIGYS
jgi:hypothetical protein